MDAEREESMRRLQDYLVSGEVLAELCKPGVKTASVSNSVPVDAVFHSAYFSHEFNAFVVRFSSEAFDTVPECGRVPIAIPGILVKAVRSDD